MLMRMNKPPHDTARPSLLVGDRAALGQPELRDERRDKRRGERWGEGVAGWLGPLVPPGLRPIAAKAVTQALVGQLPVAAPGTTVLDSAAPRRLASAP